ncbi:Fic/DOC family protein [Legionella moravica]|uniref:Death-on-curing family protein n=1 Tax=Legionella moravica TaxID=39962 RepID=A0A378K052_9GAMM|nr:Fic family protein [Legionella moravica]KTD31068.1 Fic/DOC family protein [Legionella moravica]STX63650.1 death-on-curing family protein [Legionella moravica]
MPSLLNLKIFNPALIYSFEPESSPTALMYGETMSEAPFKIGQHEDMYHAYLYAEDVILPWIHTNGLAALTPEIFENWIIKIHEHMAKSLLSNGEDMKSGEYSKTLIVRWHYGSNMMNQLALYMANLYQPKLSEAQFLKMLVKENEGLPMEYAKKFLRILQRLARDSDAPIHPSFEKTTKLKGPFLGFGTAMNRMATAWHENLLSEHERPIVEKIALFVDYPERLPNQVRHFAEEMVARWKQLDNQDLTAVSKFCADLFYRFTHIHPFPNANGRTATALNNIILRSIGLPDIIMRKPGDRSSTEGSYADAIANIEKDRRPLAAHIFQCITEAQTKPYADSSLEQLTEIRMALCRILMEIKATKPSYDLNLIDSLFAARNPIVQFLDGNDNKHSLLACQLLMVTAQDVLTGLKKEAAMRQSASSSVSSLSFLKPAYDPLVLNKGMEELTGVQGWKVTNKSSLSIWRYFDSEAEANQIVAGLKQLSFCEANVRTTKGDGKIIVLCTAINTEKLLSAPQSHASCSY